MIGVLLLLACIGISAGGYWYCKWAYRRLGIVGPKHWVRHFLGYCIACYVLSLFVLVAHSKRLEDDDFKRVASTFNQEEDASITPEQARQSVIEVSTSEQNEELVSRYEFKALPLAVYANLVLVGIAAGWMRRKATQDWS